MGSQAGVVAATIKEPKIGGMHVDKANVDIVRDRLDPVYTDPKNKHGADTAWRTSTDLPHTG